MGRHIASLWQALKKKPTTGFAEERGATLAGGRGKCIVGVRP